METMKKLTWSCHCLLPDRDCRNSSLSKQNTVSFPGLAITLRNQVSFVQQTHQPIRTIYSKEIPSEISEHLNDALTFNPRKWKYDFLAYYGEEVAVIVSSLHVKGYHTQEYLSDPAVMWLHAHQVQG